MVLDGHLDRKHNQSCPFFFSVLSMKVVAVIPRVCMSAPFEINYSGFEDDNQNSTIWLSDQYVMSRMSTDDRRCSASLAPTTGAMNSSRGKVNFSRGATLFFDITRLLSLFVIMYA